VPEPRHAEGNGRRAAVEDRVGLLPLGELAARWLRRGDEGQAVEHEQEVFRSSDLGQSRAQDEGHARHESEARPYRSVVADRQLLGCSVPLEGEVAAPEGALCSGVVVVVVVGYTFLAGSFGRSGEAAEQQCGVMGWRVARRVAGQ
jgi:hypothetical protein